MTDPVLTYAARATTVAFDATILTEGKLQVCLMQLESSVESVAGDHARPGAVAVVENLLVGGGGHGGPALAEMAPGPEPILVVTPEFAFGSDDWGAIDSAVRHSTRPIILIAGFGATPGQVLLDWHNAVGPDVVTGRHLGWDQAGPSAIGVVRPVNGGWCWVHVPGEGTHCVVFLKTLAEQNVEAVALPALQFGQTITHLRFNDVDLFPLICADLLQPVATHPDSAQARVREVVAALPVERPAMVIGSLLQGGYNVNWEIAVDSILNQVLVGRPGLVALCNVAHDVPLEDESKDRWRSLTGVYGKWDELTKGQRNLPVGRRLNVRGVVGAVVRRSEPTAATGKVDWGPYGPVDGKFIWHAEMHCACGTGGLAAPITVPAKPDGCELTRFIRRHPSEADWSPRVANGLAQVSAHIAGGTCPEPQRLLTGLLAGVASGAIDPDTLHEPRIEAAAVAAIHSLALVVTLEGMEWQSNQQHAGQLRLDATDRNILIWRDPQKTSGQMRSLLSTWKLGPTLHPDLVVLGASRMGDLEAGPIAELRRDDLAAAPPSGAELGASGGLAAAPSDITLARSRRNVAALGLAQVTKIYADYNPTQGDAAHVQQLLAEINSFFPKGAAA